MKTCTMATLGEKIRLQRKEKGFTLDTLAAAVGISKSYLWQLENSPSTRPSAEKLSALAKVLNQPLSYFLDDKVQTPREEHMDEVFFRNYRNLEREDKEHLRLILETFRKKSR
jgi:transcriptional regulator with XRE-family HTH domain